MPKFKVNKNGESEWYIVEAETAQAAIEEHFNVKTYHYNNRGQIGLYESADEDYQLFAAYLWEG